jgi:6-phosphogluconolactonase (cycloisomerase 2 family)
MEMEKNISFRSRSLMMITLLIFACVGFVVVGGGAAPLPALQVSQPSGDFAYVSNSGSGDVSMYQVNPNTGQLQSVGTVPAGGGPQAVAVAPNMQPSPFAISARPVVVANDMTNNVSVYQVNPSSGQLMSVGTVPAGNSPQAVAVDPSGHMVVVANGDSNNVSVYSVSPATGMLMSVGTVPAGQDPTAVAVHPNGNIVYVANEGGAGSINAYSVNPNTGMLTPMGPPAPMPPGSGAPSSIDVLPTGNVAVTTNPTTNTMGVFLVNPSPSPLLPGLVPIGSVPVGVGGGPMSIDITQMGQSAIAAVTLMSPGTGKAAQPNGLVAIFQVSPMGTVNLRGFAPAGNSPVSVAIDPAGFVYVANKNSNTISAFAIMPSGIPMPLGTVPAGSSPQSVALAF